MRSKARVGWILSSIFILVTWSAPCWSQGFDIHRSTGLPNTIYSGSAVETVDTASGNLRISIPLLHLPGRGLDTDIVLTYASKIWRTNVHQDEYGTWYETVQDPIGGNPALGWLLGVPRMGHYYSGAGDICFQIHPFGFCESWISYFNWTRNDGARIFLGNDNGPQPVITGYWSFDGTYMRFPSGLSTGRYKDGVTVTTTNTQITLKDTNGNQISCAHQNSMFPTYTSCTDTLGRIVNFNYANGLLQSFTYADSSGATRTISFGYVTYRAYYPWTNPGEVCYDFTTPVPCGAETKFLETIILPNGLSYRFEYLINSDGSTTGEILKLILPTGGYVRYTYDWSTDCDDGDCPPVYDGTGIKASRLAHTRVVAARIVSEDGTVGGERTWSYDVRRLMNGVTTSTVTDPLGNQEVITENGFPTKVELKDPSGVVLRTVDRQMGFDNSSYNDPDPNGTQPSNQRLVAQTTTLNETNQKSKVEFAYGTHGNVTEKREYDWGAGAVGPLLRRTTFTYLHNSISDYAGTNVHILDRVTTQAIYDASGVLRAQATTVYDALSNSSTSGIVQHDYSSHPASYNLRANPNQVQRWLNTTGAWLATTNTFNDVGNLLSTTDPGGHATTFSYADNFYNYTPPQPTSAYPTQTTMPTTGGVSHVQRQQFYFDTGLVAATCGENYPAATSCAFSTAPSQPDHFAQEYDALNRPTTSRHSGGIASRLEYNEGSLQISVAVSSRLSAASANPPNQLDTANSLVSLNFYDGLGRARKTKLASDPQGPTYTLTEYDALGRKLRQRNATRCDFLSPPYSCPPESTFGRTEFEYDALSRVTKVIPPDGTSASNHILTQYSGNTITATDQAGKQRRSYTDALGRLIRVDEPGPSGPTGGTPGTGSVTINGTEQSVEDGEWVYECVLWDWDGACAQWDWVWYGQTYWDYGGVSITVNGFTKSANYGQGSTGATIASALASAFNGDSASPVNASASSNVVTLTAKTTGSASNYSFSATSWTNDPTHFPGPSFTPAPSGSTLTGGTDGSPGTCCSLSTPAVTLYTYDALDNLTQVLQAGPRQRSFLYNSLGQLTSVTNPESGAVNYTYDADGNLLTKADARSITTTFAYDALHRLLSKTYSDSTPAASFTYDTAVDGLSIQNAVGRLVKAATANTRTVNSYDTTGGVATQWQCTPANCGTGWFTMNYGYDLLRNPVSQSNPMGFTLTHSFNAAARPTQIISTWNDAQHPGTLASGVSYNAAGARTQFTFGNGLAESISYNNRFQPTELRTYYPATGADSIKLTYGFSDASGNNNGSVMSWSAAAAQAFSRSYAYDALNRLDSASGSLGGSCTGLQWTYDAWGNRTQQTTTGGTCGQSQIAVNNLNRIADTGFQYDAAGNMTTEPGRTYQYDAENRLVSVNGGAIASYVYDADGNRVRKTTGGVSTDYVYGLSGSVIAERQGSTWTKGYIYFGGLLAQYSSETTYFAHRDHLGSTRLLTRVDRSIQECLDYYPYGELIPCPDSSTTTHRFTGQERDSETGLDNFIARYFASLSGRFLSPDPENAGASPDDPQSWNAYAYARNNPAIFVDPNGQVYCREVVQDGSQLGTNNIILDCIPNWQFWQDPSKYVSDGFEYWGTSSIDDTEPIYEDADAWWNQNAFARAVYDFFDGDSIGKATRNTYESETFEGQWKSGLALVLITASQAFTGGRGKLASKADDLVREAQKRYPKLAGLIHKHHIRPRYLGGAKNGPTKALDAAYHQMVTNEFRALAVYGKSAGLTEKEILEIIKKVYKRFPLE